MIIKFIGKGSINQRLVIIDQKSLRPKQPLQWLKTNVEHYWFVI